MRSFYLILLLSIGFSTIIFAQKAEKIISIVQKQHPIAYYHTQAKLWKAKLEKETTNAEAWGNYYAACRMANLSTKKAPKPYDLNEIIEQAGKQIPSTFEYHWIAYWNYGPGPKYYHHLDKAYEIDPTRSEIYDGLVSRAELLRDKAKRAIFTEQLHETGNFSPGAMAWNYNQLISVTDRSILLTYGDFDTYPSWILQDVKAIKKDVELLNVNLLGQAAYRKKVFAELAVPPLSSFAGDVPRTKITDFVEALVPHLAQNTQRAVYLGVGCGEAIINRLENQLYLVGLAFKYSKKEFDNMVVLQKNIEQNFLLDQLKMILYKDHAEERLNQLNINYLPALVMLYQHYEAQNNAARHQLKSLIEGIAKRGGKEEYLSKIF